MKFLMVLFIVLNTVWAKNSLSIDRLNMLSGEAINETDSQSRWDQVYARSSFLFGKTPAKFLAENFDYIKPESSILDMGMGEGRNAVFLAQKGHKVTGIDISSVAIKKSYMLAKEYNVKIKGIVGSLDKYQFSPQSFDALICFYYVDRTLIDKMISWLKPGGILVYEAYTEEQKNVKDHNSFEDDQYLKSQELLGMFKGLKVLKYEEPEHENKFRSSIILKKEE